MKKYIYYLLPLLALLFAFNFKFYSEASESSASFFTKNYGVVTVKYDSSVSIPVFVGSTPYILYYPSSYPYESEFFIEYISSSSGNFIRRRTSMNINSSYLYIYYYNSSGSQVGNPISQGFSNTSRRYSYFNYDGKRVLCCLIPIEATYGNYFDSSVSPSGFYNSSYISSNYNASLVGEEFYSLFLDGSEDVDLGQLNYSVVDLVGERQSISLQFNGTTTGLENGEFEVEYSIMDNSYAYDTSFNAITGQITGRSFFDWSNGRDPSTGEPYEMSDPDIGDWFLSGFLVSPNWNNINTDDVTVTDTLIPALTKNFYHKLSDPVNIGSPDVYAFSYPGNISDHMDSYQYRNQLTGYNYMPSYSIYVRPVKDYIVGQWSVVHWYMNQNNEAVVSKTTPSTNSNNMPTNNSVQTITQNGDTYNIVINTYPDGTTDYPVLDPIFSLPEIAPIDSGDHDKEDSDILEKLLELIEAMKQFPDFLSSLFDFFNALLGWLPASVINFIRFCFLFLFILILVRAVKIIV